MYHSGLFLLKLLDIYNKNKNMKIKQNTFLNFIFPTEARRERSTCIFSSYENATVYVVDLEVTTLQKLQHFTIF